jgi:hypothetical protein
LTTLLGDDLEVPSIGEDDDAIEVEENEDGDGDLDDYQDFGLENILNVLTCSYRLCLLS